jgi:hypothetical protein
LYQSAPVSSQLGAFFKGRFPDALSSLFTNSGWLLLNAVEEKAYVEDFRGYHPTSTVA